MEKWTFEDLLYFLLETGIFQAAMLVYQRGINVDHFHLPLMPGYGTRLPLPYGQFFEASEVDAFLLGKQINPKPSLKLTLPSRGWIHIPPWEWENHLQNTIFGGYVNSLEGSTWKGYQSSKHPFSGAKMLLVSGSVQMNTNNTNLDSHHTSSDYDDKATNSAC